MKMLRKIVRTGLADGQEYHEKRAILLSNYISLTLSGALFTLFIIRRIVFGDVPGGVTTVHLVTGIIVFTSPVFLNGIGKTTLARLILCYVPILYLWWVYISLMKEMPLVESVEYDSCRIFLLALGFIPYLMFDRTRKGLLWSGIVPTLISLLFFDVILSGFGVGVHDKGQPTATYWLMMPRTVVAYGIISVSCFIFQAIIAYNDELTAKIQLQLRLKTEEVNQRNRELMESQERLNDMNARLEEMVQEKTQRLLRQNERIIKYAYTNAHHVRGPVARMLGLIQLSRMENSFDYPWLFGKLEEQAIEVDVIIKDLGRELEEEENALET